MPEQDANPCLITVACFSAINSSYQQRQHTHNSSNPHTTPPLSTPYKYSAANCSCIHVCHAPSQGIAFNVTSKPSQKTEVGTVLHRQLVILQALKSSLYIFQGPVCWAHSCVLQTCWHITHYWHQLLNAHSSPSMSSVQPLGIHHSQYCFRFDLGKRT